MTTLVQAIASVAERFERAALRYGHGTDNPWDEAVALVIGVTGLPDDETQAEIELTAHDVAAIDRLAEARITQRMPLPYLLGRARYRGLDFLVESGVVVPRSPIAQLIEAEFRPWLVREPWSIVDLGCGSGCLGILCAHAFPGAQVTLIDIDPAAVRLARRNVVLHRMEDRVTVVQSDLFCELPTQRWDLVVSNPPYVDAADLAALPAEYRHEPVLGLAGGDDGLGVVARLLHALPDHMSTDGLLVCEVGASSPALLRRYPQVPFVWPDLSDGAEGVFVLMAEMLDESAVRQSHSA
jgi:ribosomal protein L3 glutamine methyltransferase